MTEEAILAVGNIDPTLHLTAVTRPRLDRRAVVEVGAMLSGFRYCPCRAASQGHAQLGVAD
jgi:hypothetical protein